tara:strand:- start:140 stop:1030 length:891 start_codon:yes stop_codon:yes gene_type:complete
MHLPKIPFSMKNIFHNNKIIPASLIDNLIDEIKESSESQQRISQSITYLEKCLARYHHDIRIIKSLLPKGKILEIGAYPFHLTYFLKKMGFTVSGIDLDPSRFRTIQSQNDLDVRKIDIEKEKFCFEQGEFDLIIFNEVFEHLKEPIQALAEINRVLKNNGKLLLTTPNIYFLPHLVYFLSGKGLICDAFTAFSKPYWLGHMGHVREYSSRELRVFLERLGFKIIQIDYVQNRLFLNFKKNRHLATKEKLSVPLWVLAPLNLINLLLVTLFPFLRENIVITALKSEETEDLFRAKF